MIVLRASVVSEGGGIYLFEGFMKVLMLGNPGFLMFVAVMVCFVASSFAWGDGLPTSRPAVVVELFTSEGCSSCPPADDLLADLAKPDAVAGVQIIPMALHVDYWNGLGWTDRFSSAQFSDRQKEYARLANSDDIYTPQMIVDGKAEFVGSDGQRANTEIANAARLPKAKIELMVSRHEGAENAVDCKISIDQIPAGEAAGGEVMLAVTEDGLQTDVGRGENSGRTLHHSAVVRVLRKVATIGGSDAMPFSTSATISLSPDWRADQLHFIVFGQNPRTGEIWGGDIQRSPPDAEK
jgi:hypothetical protein